VLAIALKFIQKDGGMMRFQRDGCGVDDVSGPVDRYEHESTNLCFFVCSPLSVMSPGGVFIDSVFGRCDGDALKKKMKERCVVSTLAGSPALHDCVSSRSLSVPINIPRLSPWMRLFL
jgi:hypothetical protein